MKKAGFAHLTVGANNVRPRAVNDRPYDKRTENSTFSVLFIRLACFGSCVTPFGCTIGRKFAFSCGRRGTAIAVDEELLGFYDTSSVSATLALPSRAATFPHWGRLILCAPKDRLLFLTSTAFAYTKAKPRTRRGGDQAFFGLVTISAFTRSQSSSNFG